MKKQPIEDGATLIFNSEILRKSHPYVEEIAVSFDFLLSRSSHYEDFKFALNQIRKDRAHIRI